MANAKLEFKLVDNIEELKKATEEQIAKALWEVGNEAVNYVAELVPVDTGRLRGSITHEVRENSVIVGTNVEYAAAVEFNEKAHHEEGHAHYLRDGITNHLDEYKRILKESLEEG